MADKGEGEKQSDSEENVTNGPAAEQIVTQTAEDYATYFKFNVAKEKVGLEDSIEEMLMRLEEFISLVDMIRAESSLSLNRTIPEIYTKSLEMKRIFEKIDQLEVFVARVRQDVSVLEEQVNTAEDELELGSLSSIKKAFSSLPIPFKQTKKAPSKPKAEVKKYKPPEIFRSEDFFKKEETSEETQSSNSGER
ncbi:biogenesis of lysosome-related organelles complex 1 subunit 4-like [Ptychodera flava]|uniref:biogenesis of lysosome-related organelles complex 1 subunit 4-like n=1 Tax=Ptychodera flava TaxID=63121 RepID=UPI00396AA7A0